mmetsp:Transcript_80045/g.226533  ORF Transcript_80045/g.226533 Transcript_80045/m.226533 type:complete len:204 (-) Transcript_80045:63-674(-)|eukprot:CAMPEP_0168394698 /NCGR_PEP_ID=MMETSP0228-20121227/19668_1 /TAXON_ID=133427 /ORGANISM="Protoceratium reticulatum, Strain CCCM 535 (=CCMP 1889)" /LENGTH=203 /DNA_ID=CAMNT_0008408119 /DNA_START=1 /DNA_END=612 /DNA_ORIENTATION=-
MQLERLSLLSRGRPELGPHVYYSPASEPSAPAGRARPPVAPLPAELPDEPPSALATSTEERHRREAREALVAAEEPVSPVLSAVLEQRRREAREALRAEPATLPRRRHTWGGDADFGPQWEEEPKAQPTVAARAAALMLPGLKRLRQNAPPEERGRLTQEIAQLQRVLGVGRADPNPVAFCVFPRSGADVDHGERALTRSVSL